MNTNTIYNEPCLDTLKKMPDEFLDCVITSPPYWQLRDYGYDGQWGLEATFQEYLEHLWEMMDEIYRVLKPSGTTWINLGDTYSRTGGKSIGNPNPNSIVGNTKKGIQGGNCNGVYGVEDKCLLLLPHRFAIGCIDRGWIMRNDIIWAKRNGMPESVTDRFSKKHEYFFFMVKSQKYYFDLDSIRDKQIYGNERVRFSKHPNNNWGKNPGSVSDFWDIPTKPSKESHYAQYSDELIKKPILAGCPENGIVYDPFMGSGSTAEACLRANRQFIGSEMSTGYLKIANKRLEPLLTQVKLF